MIYKNGRELSARYVGRKVVLAVYLGAKLIWEVVASCFGSGYWSNDKPWSNADGWRNDKQ